MTIDETLANLESITARLEAENLTLEEALTLFEQGIELATAAKNQLDEAKLKVVQVIEKAKETFDLEDFDLP